MAAAYTNSEGLPLSMCVWLVSDYYDYTRTGLSVTQLLKPIKQTILARRVPIEAQVADVTSMIQNRLGAAIHDSIEKAWLTNHETALGLLGFGKGIISRVKVNPDPTKLKDGEIPVYLEQRSSKEVHGISVSGQFDFVGDGAVEDFKSTTTFSYIKGTKDDDYIMQGSMYRWLRPDIITKDILTINFIFTDWQKAQARSQPDKYPQSRVTKKVYPLKSYAETEQWVKNRVNQLITLADADEDDLPPCSDEELWRSDPVYKYYANPEKANQPGARSTKNFDNEAAAKAHLADKGFVGVIKTVPGEVKACTYCAAFPICKQKDALIRSGDLVI